MADRSCTTDKEPWLLPSEQEPWLKVHAAAIEVLCMLVAQLLRRVPEAVVVSVKQEVGAFRLPTARPVEAPEALGPVQRAAGVSGGPTAGGRGHRQLVCWRGGGADR